MQNPITRARDFTRRHRTALTFSAGAAAGAGVVTYAGLKILGANDLIIASPDMLHKLINEPDGGVRWPRPWPFGDIILANESNATLKQ